jgi:predicted RNA polymerase sigma factor
MFSEIILLDKYEICRWNHYKEKIIEAEKSKIKDKELKILFICPIPKIKDKELKMLIICPISRKPIS